MSNSKIFSLNEKEKIACVKLARRAIAHYFDFGKVLALSKEEVSSLPKKLLSEKACFVTPTINEELRGCIGHLVAFQPLYLDIIENALNAAFNDPRFYPLEREELSNVKIEVSILTEPIDVSFSSPKELLEKIRPNVDGLIIRKNHCSATFLPSVWKELPSKEEFLSNLCLKAGLSKDEWKKPGLKVQRYEAIKAIEK